MKNIIQTKRLILFAFLLILSAITLSAYIYSQKKSLVKTAQLIDYDTSIDTSKIEPDGKTLFNANCAMCHKGDQKLTGPALLGVYNRWPDLKLLRSYIKDSKSVIKKNAYAKALWIEYGKMESHQFPKLTDKEIDNALDYGSMRCRIGMVPNNN